MKKSLIVLSTLLILFGCSTPQEERLDQYLEQTNTHKKERTVDWYYKNDYQRLDVLNICNKIYLEAAEKAGYYSANISEGKEQYLDPKIEKEFYLSNHECNSALKAQELLDKYITDKSVPQEIIENTPITPIEISASAALDSSSEAMAPPPDLKELTRTND